MKFGKLNKPHFKIWVNVAKYKCDWNKVVSKPQKQVKDFLYPYWCGCVVLEEFRIPGSLLRIDLMNINRKIAVEISPASSHSFNKFFHGNHIRYGAAVKRELDKSDWLKENDFKLVEVFEDDLDKLSPSWFMEKYGITI